MSRNPIAGIQEDFEGRLLAEPYFSDVAIIQQRRALTVDEISGQLGVLKGRASKVGACVIVKLPVLDVVDPNVPGPRTSPVQQLLIIEHPTHNASAQGTGKSAEQLAIAALQLFHHFVPYGVTQVFVGDQNAIVPDESLPGLRAYVVTFTSFVQLAVPSKVIRPTITIDTNVTLACATSGAAIYYTTDESYPSASNTAATLYSAPFTTPASGTVIRVAGEKTGSQQSDIAQQSVT